MNKQSFLLPEIPQIPLPAGYTADMEVTYFSDCVFKPYIYKFNEGEVVVVEDKLTIDFGFLVSKVKTVPKILDNIGVLKIGTLIRFGVLVTKEKEGLFVSLID